MHLSAATMTTKPHMIRLRNSEYQVHQKHLIEMMAATGSFSAMKDPLIRRKEKSMQFNRDLHRSLGSPERNIRKENERLMNNIVNITATDSLQTAAVKPEKKSLANQFKKWQDRRIRQENRDISNRMFSQ